MQCATSSAALAVDQSRSEALTGSMGARRACTDFAAVDALQVDGRDAEVAVPELALDHDQRYAFARKLVTASGIGRLPIGEPGLTC
jgi:hypothetical protein